MQERSAKAMKDQREEQKEQEENNRYERRSEGRRYKQGADRQKLTSQVRQMGQRASSTSR